MARLRRPEDGCPWDLEQTYASIVPSTIEETYEVADCIERGDFDHLSEELGDLLFQVVFYSQLATEEGRFNFDDCVDQIVTKLLRRHPHVFPDGTLTDQPGDTRDPAAIARKWESIKAEEREKKGLRGVLDDVPKALPALVRAQKLQKRLANAGWDWQQLDDVVQALDSEIQELKLALAQAKQDDIAPDADPHVKEELGDVLFGAVNVARFIKSDAETLLRASNRKFEDRITAIEQRLISLGKDFESATDVELDQLWEEVKLSLRGDD
jgi:ATP diphosphatase